MHGEYKVPGGKLVMADVEVADGQLARVSISGDFFLEPDSALEIIDEALTGMPVNARVPALAAAIDNAPGDSVEMVGFDAQDRKSTRLNSSHVASSYAVLCLQKT